MQHLKLATDRSDGRSGSQSLKYSLYGGDWGEGGVHSCGVRTVRGNSFLLRSGFLEFESLRGLVAVVGLGRVPTSGCGGASRPGPAV